MENRVATLCFDPKQKKFGSVCIPGKIYDEIAKEATRCLCPRINTFIISLGMKGAGAKNRKGFVEFVEKHKALGTSFVLERVILMGWKAYKSERKAEAKKMREELMKFREATRASASLSIDIGGTIYSADVSQETFNEIRSGRARDRLRTNAQFVRKILMDFTESKNLYQVREKLDELAKSTGKGAAFAQLVKSAVDMYREAS